MTHSVENDAGLFWEDHAADMRDPEYAEAFAATEELIRTLDGIANARVTPPEEGAS